MKNLNVIQTLYIVSIILIVTGFLQFFADHSSWGYKALQVITVIGFILFIYTSRKKKASKIHNSKLLTVALLTGLPSLLYGQDYATQIHAFEQSFIKRDTAYITPHISNVLKFDPVPASKTPFILHNIITKLPKLNDMTIIGSENGQAQIQYDFDALGQLTSSIHFDAEGQITRIELIENLIKQEIEQQKRAKASVQAPQAAQYEEYPVEKLQFPSRDGLEITANLYSVDPTKPIILLCHQAGYNKFEYADIAPRLNELGYTAMAIDLRSGGSFAEHPNETHNRAIEKGISMDFLDARQDIEAAIDYLSTRFNQKVIVWGSSYSSSLALHVAATNKNVKAVIAFSPGDYFGKTVESLATIFPDLSLPFLITSSKEESTALKKLLEPAHLKNNQRQFIPISKGFHGSRALWIGQQGAEEYWKAITSFLNKVNS